jgi:uncharacterized protein YcsI (UPF0317 family)
MQDHRHDGQEANVTPKHSQHPANDKLQDESAGFQAVIGEILSEEDHQAAQRKLGAAQLRIAKGLNRITAIGAIVGALSDDLVAFLLGCSLTFEHALIDAGICVRNVEGGTLVPMFVSNLACRPAGRFHGPVVVTMRPIPKAQVQLVGELTARYPHAHGAPLHVGSPQAIGIADLGRPDYGDPVAIHPGEVSVFWACGVTPQAVALEARPEFMITHEPGIMFLTDLPREGDSRS